MKYHLSRSITIDAPVKKVRPHVADFNKWEAWSPWDVVDPDQKSKSEGKPGEVGHKMSWEGEITGSGKMAIEKVEGDNFYHDLEFLAPFKSKAKTSVLLKEEGGKTKVTWTMDSSMPFFLFFMVKTMKSWIEMDYDRGLRMLKAVVEKGKVNAKTTNEGVVDFEGFGYVGLQNTAHADEMPKKMSKDFEKLMKDLEKNSVKAEKWICVYPKVKMAKKLFTWVASASDENLKDKDLGSEYVKGEIKSGKMLKIRHKGSYQFLGNAWSMGMMYVQSKKKEGMKQGDKPFEFYVNSPVDTKEEDLITEIYFPLK